MTITGQALEQLLPSETWLSIFALLAPQVSSDQRQMHLQLQEYSCFHQLKAVCKQFHTLFCQNPWLYSHLLIPDETAVSVLLPNETLSQHIVTLQLVEGGPKATKLLAALTSPALQAVCLRDFQNCELLPKFARLTSCVLQLEKYESAYIEDLKQLPLLTDLHLQGGHFFGLQHLSHLTNLSINEAYAGPSLFEMGDMGDALVAKLRILRMCQACFPAFSCSRGLAAMSQLECLHLCDSYVNAALPQDIYDTRGQTENRVPSSLSTLTKLSELCIDMGNTVQLHVDPDWVCHLTSLRSLSVEY
ncbi:hypothetical protein ABBQ38_000086 [Trebouxia sp. C0009 RCD-2024]